MAFAIISVFLVSLAVLASSQSDSSSDFADQVKQDLPDDAYNKIFAANIDKDIVQFQVLLADAFAVIKFYQITGEVPNLLTLLQIKLQTSRIAREGKLNPEIIFKAVTTIVYNSLDQTGTLKDNSVSDLAQQFADILKEEAQSLSTDDKYPKTFPTLIGAAAKFFKALGLTSQKDFDLEQQNLVDELQNI